MPVRALLLCAVTSVLLACAGGSIEGPGDEDPTLAGQEQSQPSESADAGSGFAVETGTATATGTCARGATQKCWVGAPEQAGVGACTFGTQTCEASGEFGTWGPCTGSGAPSAETCDGIDNDCDGVVDEDLTRSCYDGPTGSDKLPGCKTGTQTCSAGSWGACVGEVTDCKPPCIGGGAPGTAPWQINRYGGPMCFGKTFSVHGEKGEYDYSSIPAESASGWSAVSATSIDFSEGSAMCGRGCDCLNGGEFTYFQTFFDIPTGYTVSSLSVSFGGVDDGARVTVFNSAYPGGIVDDGSYIYIGGSPVTTNLAKFIVPGKNRIVITHVDDCCSWRSLTGVKVVLNGTSLGSC